MFLLLLRFWYVVPDQYRAVMTHGFTIFEPGNPHWQMITGKPPEDQAKKPLILPTHPPTPPTAVQMQGFLGSAY